MILQGYESTRKIGIGFFSPDTAIAQSLSSQEGGLCVALKAGEIRMSESENQAARKMAMCYASKQSGGLFAEGTHPPQAEAHLLRQSPVTMRGCWIFSFPSL